MSTTPLKESLPGEHIVQVEPTINLFVSADWRSRPNLYSGRALSAEALSLEQRQRGGRLATRGQLVSPGVIAGLAVRVEGPVQETEGATTVTRWYLQISPGAGVSASGEDVVVPRLLRVRVDELPVFTSEGPSDEIDDIDALPKLGALSPYAGILLLVPTVTEKTRANPDGCDVLDADPDDYAFEDELLVDGCALVLFTWPAGAWAWEQPALGTPTLRNELANIIFRRERARDQGELAPWEETGVPIALIAFKGATFAQPWAPEFVDRASVVRPGGAPRGRTRLAPGQGSPLLWQAQIQQFAEHVADLGMEAMSQEHPLSAFRYLPPVAPLPFVAMAAMHEDKSKFPFLMNVMPVPLEQLDGVVAASASLAPIPVDMNRRARVLVPVPEAYYEPRLLLTEEVDPAFNAAILEALDRLDEWLRRRKDLRDKLTLLRDAIEGKRSDRFPEIDPSAVPGEHVGSSSLNPGVFGPEEGPYGTKGSTIPVLDDILRRFGFEGDWGPAEHLVQPPISAVSAACSPDGSQIGVAYSNGSHLYFMHISEAGRVIELVDPSVLSFKLSVAWTGTEFLIIYLLSEGDITNKVRVARRGAEGGWELQTTPELIVSWQGFSTCVWGDGCVDVFIGAQDVLKIYQLSWVNGSLGELHNIDLATIPLAEGTILPPPGTFFSEVSAIALGDGKIEIWCPTRSWDGNPSRAYRASAHHAVNGFYIVWDQIQSINGFNPYFLNACAANPGRVDIISTPGFVDTYLQHSWFQSGALTHGDVVANLNGSSLITMLSPHAGRLDVFWFDSSFAAGSVLQVWHRRFEQGWFPAVKLDERSSGAADFAVVARGYSPTDMFVAAGSLFYFTKAHPDAGYIVRRSGLRGLIAYIEERSKLVDDFVDSTFLKVQAEVQRLRQLMIVGTTEASRLAASPVLGFTMGEQPTAARADIGSYFRRVRTRSEQRSLNLPDAKQAMHAAATMKRGVIQQLIDLVQKSGLEIEDVLVRGVALPGGSFGTTETLVLYTLVQIPQEGPPTSRSIVVLREDIPLGDFLSDPTLRETLLARIGNELHRVDNTLASLGNNVPAPQWTEAQYFSVAVQILESALALLRDIERLLKFWETAVDGYQAALARIEGSVGSIEKRLRVIESEVTEARHDVTVARALLTEEKARIDAINERRQSIVKDHVQFVVIQRARERELTLDTPARALDTSVAEPVLPAALASTEAAPPELWAFVEILRDAPLGWLANSPALLRRVDRLDHLVRTLELAQARASIAQATRAPVVYAAAPAAASKLALGLQRVTEAQRGIILLQRGVTATMELSIQRQRTWKELQEVALERLSLGDLIDASHGRSDVAKLAAEELERVAKVATGLYERFGEVLPIIRLEWAEAMSQYDEAVDLRDLARLAQWDRIDVADRRALQTLVDWLFQRVNRAQTEAVSLMNDLVRASILLASHAPVDELTSGHVAKPVAAKVGGLIELSVDTSKIRVGMHAMVQSSGHAVQAVVEDVDVAAVRARVVTASAAVVNLAEKTTAKFSEPARGKGKILASATPPSRGR